MQTAYLRNKLYLRSLQIITLLVGICLLNPAIAQNKKSIEKSRVNLPNYDERTLTYGFTIGLHTTSLRPRFSSGTFVEYDSGLPTTDTLLYIETPQKFGFSIGFLGSLKAAQYLDIRFMPQVSFFDYPITFLDKNGEEGEPERPVDFTTMDLPLSLKFKSSRRGNYRMFFTAGATAQLDLTSKKKSEERSEFLTVQGDNLTADVGFGVDIYFPLFKFSPEIRYSYGLVDLKGGNSGVYDPNFEGMSSQKIGLYLVFN
jgi:hypothetical protein